MRYIELNPVRANMVTHPGEYKWSSYAENAQGSKDLLLTRHPLYYSLGEDASKREYAYRELFRHHLDSTKLHDIHEALNHELVLGRSWFKEKIEAMTKRQTMLGLTGSPSVNEEAADYWLPTFD